jgi:hypothetical protein
MAFAASLGSIRRIPAGLLSAEHGSHRATVNNGPRPINLTAARQPIEQGKVNQVPHGRPLPVAQSSPTGHA